MEEAELLQKKAKILSLAGDPTRIKMLCILFNQKEACVSDIAKNLNMSIASISHHLQLLRESHMVSSRRDGCKICYRVETSSMMSGLKKLICGTSL